MKDLLEFIFFKKFPPPKLDIPDTFKDGAWEYKRDGESNIFRPFKRL